MNKAKVLVGLLSLGSLGLVSRVEAMPNDKVQHGLLGMVVYKTVETLNRDKESAYITTGVVAVGKELFDERFNVKDIGATMLGAVACDLLTKDPKEDYSFSIMSDKDYLRFSYNIRF